MDCRAPLEEISDEHTLSATICSSPTPNSSFKVSNDSESLSSNEDFEVIGRKRIQKDAGIKRKHDDVSASEECECTIIKKGLKIWTHSGKLSAKEADRTEEKTVPPLAHDESTKKRRPWKDSIHNPVEGRQKSENRNVKNDHSRRTTLEVLFFAAVACVFIAFQHQFLKNYWAAQDIAAKDGIISKQNELIANLQEQLMAFQDVFVLNESTLLAARIDENRARSFERKAGYEYYLVLVDWKRDGREPKQHLNLALKQSNGSIYVYDHGSCSGKQFAVGDRVVDVDGRQYTSANAVREHIMHTHRRKEYFTCIIERPISEEAKKNAFLAMQPEMSSFSVIVSTFP